MKKLIILLLAALFAVGTAFADENEYFIICKPGTTVNVREKPKMRSEVIAAKSFGDMVISDGEEKNGFVHVVGLAAEVEDGWIYKGLLVQDKPVEVNMLSQVYNGRVAARQYADGKIIRWLKDGSEVRVFATSQEWCVTEYGFVKTDYLTINARVSQ